MFQLRLQSYIAATLVLCMLVTATCAHAATRSTTHGARARGVSAQETTAGTMIVDLLILRPLGIVGTAVGIAVFIASLPFSLPTRSTKDAAQKLVVAPVKYTFTRPLGQVEGLIDP